MRKILAVILATILLASVLAGCGGGAESGSPSAPQGEASAPSATPDPGTPAAEPNVGSDGIDHGIAPPGVNYSVTYTEPVNLVWASDGAGTSDYTSAATLVSHMQRWLPAGSTVTQETIASGSAGTGYLIEAGLCDVGGGQNAMSATIGLEGRPPYSQVRALYCTNSTNFVVQIMTDKFVKNTGYTSLREILENKYPAIICAEDVGSSDYVSLLYAFEILGYTFDDFKGWGGQIITTSGSTCCDMLQDGQADIMVAHCNPTSSSIAELCMTSDVHVYAFDDEIYDGMVARGFANTTIKVGTYDRFPEEKRSVYIGSSRIVHEEMSNELAYEMTRISIEQITELAQELPGYRDLTFKKLTDTTCSVVPFHPGAILFYQDIGVLDAQGNYIGEPEGWRLPKSEDFT